MQAQEVATKCLVIWRLPPILLIFLMMNNEHGNDVFMLQERYIFIIAFVICIITPDIVRFVQAVPRDMWNEGTTSSPTSLMPSFYLLRDSAHACAVATVPTAPIDL